MKWVRIKDGAVFEIIPESATPVEDWYGADFAAQCVEAPDEVEQRWTYDAKLGTFAAPVEAENPGEPSGDTARIAALEEELAALKAAVVRGIELGTA